MQHLFSQGFVAAKKLRLSNFLLRVFTTFNIDNKNFKSYYIYNKTQTNKS